MTEPREKTEYEAQRWATIVKEKYVVITPTWDIEPHDLENPNCKCQPRVQSGDREMMYEKPMMIHNSFRDQKMVDEAMDRLF